jgi:hypothetical protein
MLDIDALVLVETLLKLLIDESSLLETAPRSDLDRLILPRAPSIALMASFAPDTVPISIVEILFIAPVAVVVLAKYSAVVCECVNTFTEENFTTPCATVLSVPPCVKVTSLPTVDAPSKSYAPNFAVALPVVWSKFNIVILSPAEEFKSNVDLSPLLNSAVIPLLLQI